MAGDWIAMRVDLADDPAVIRIAGALGLDEFGVIGRLHRLWCWADQQTVDGVVTLACAKRDAPSVTESTRGAHELARGAHEDNTLRTLFAWIDRHVVATGFAEMMVRVGWLAVEEDGIRFPNFERWNSQTGKRRLLGAKREARRREKNAENVTHPASRTCAKRDAPSVTNVPKRDAASATSASPTGEERRGEKREEEPPTPLQGEPSAKQHFSQPRGKKPADRPDDVPIPERLRTDDFLAAWREWIDDRAERRKPLTARAAKQQLASLAELPVAAAIECIKASIANQWQGLFPERFRGGQNGQLQQRRFETQEERMLRQIQEAQNRP